MAKIALAKYVSGCCEKMKSNVPESEIIEYVEDVCQSGDYNNLATRIAQAVARAAGYQPCYELYLKDYLTISDRQLTSLYKKAFESAFPSVWEDIKAMG